MAILVKQTTLNQAAQPMGTIPNGPCNVAISNVDNTDVVIGLSNSVTLTSPGTFVVPSNGSIEFFTYPSPVGATLYGLVSTGTAVVSVLISTTD